VRGANNPSGSYNNYGTNQLGPGLADGLKGPSNPRIKSFGVGGLDTVASSHAILENNVEEPGIGGLRTNFPCARDLFWNEDLLPGRKE
jgi:hypothetical protein